MCIRNDANSLTLFAYWDKRPKHPIIKYVSIIFLCTQPTFKVADNQDRISEMLIMASRNL
jgi:hypothetical protein